MYVSGSSIEKGYDTLKALDINKDNKVSGQEIQFANLLNKVKENPSAENVKKASDLIDKITKDPVQKPEFRKVLLLTLMSVKCSDPPKVSELNDILKILPGKDKTKWADNISALSQETKEREAKVDKDGVMEITLPDNISNYTQYNEKKGEFFALPDTTIPSFKEKFEQLNTSVLELAKDILDGDTNIKGVDKTVVEMFLGKQADSATLNTYKSDSFDPDKFVTFDVKIRKHTIKHNDQEIYIDRSINMSDKSTYTDLSTGKTKQVNASELRNILTVNYSDFKKFSEDNNLFDAKGEFDSTKLNIVKKFVDTITDIDKKMNFVSNFMSAYYVHSAEGVDQKNINEDNFTDILASPQMLKSNDGRPIIDCQFFAVIAQNLLGVSKGNNSGLSAKDVVLSTPTKESPDGLHQVTLLKDSGSGKFFIQSNNRIQEITKEELKKIGWSEKKGPPSDVQLVKAANYTPPKSNKDQIKGLLADQFSDGTKFYNYSIKDDPLSNQLPEGHTKLADLPEGGVKTKDAKGTVYFIAADGRKLPEKAGPARLPNVPEGELTISGAGQNFFVGKIKEKNGKEHDLKISWQKGEKPKFDIIS